MAPKQRLHGIGRRPRRPKAAQNSDQMAERTLRGSCRCSQDNEPDHTFARSQGCPSAWGESRLGVGSRCLAGRGAVGWGRPPPALWPAHAASGLAGPPQLPGDGLHRPGLLFSLHPLNPLMRSICECAQVPWSEAQRRAPHEPLSRPGRWPMTNGLSAPSRQPCQPRVCWRKASHSVLFLVFHL